MVVQRANLALSEDSLLFLAVECLGTTQEDIRSSGLGTGQHKVAFFKGLEAFLGSVPVISGSALVDDVHLQHVLSYQLALLLEVISVLVVVKYLNGVGLRLPQLDARLLASNVLSVTVV